MDIGERVVKLETQMERVEAGIANFVQFQKESRDFYSRYDEREKEGKRRQNFLIALLGLIATAIIATCAILALHPSETRSALKDLNLSTSQYQYTVAERTTK